MLEYNIMVYSRYEILSWNVAILLDSYKKKLENIYRLYPANILYLMYFNTERDQIKKIL